ncbi:MAG: aminopeptidase P N-terminal domain-containing protein, partial [Gammaproteobacteria bacterium]
MQIYHQRRQQLAQQLLPNSCVIIPSARETLRNGDTHYPFRQNSDFYYLTGFSEPDSFAVLRTRQTGEMEYILFVRPNDVQMEIWNGKRAGLEGACAEFGANTAYSTAEFITKLPELLRDQQQIYYPFGHYAWFDELFLKEITKLREARMQLPAHVHDLHAVLSELRLYKTSEEIGLMQRASDISAQAHIRGMQICKPNMFEYELAAEYLYYFTKEGGMGAAYPSIVAAGANACTLHYTENCAPMQDGDLILVDAGAEYQYYGADITRTFPINGRFSAEQRAVYEIVLAAQAAVIAALKPGIPFVTSQNICTRVITEGLV